MSRVIRDVTGQRQFELYGSGRTDAGVHALEQVAHLDIITGLPADTLRREDRHRLPLRGCVDVRTVRSVRL